MNSKDPNRSGEFPNRREMTVEEQAAYLALHKSKFDPIEAEREYGELMEKGTITWEQLLLELDEIDRQAAPAQPRSP